MAEGKKTTFTPAEVAQASGASRLDSWRIAGFFPPVAPPAPVAQEAVQGRQYDYSQGFNLLARPRQEESGNPSFQQLRNLADNYDLLRLVIETRKDQLVGLNWNIIGRDDDGEGVKKDDPRIKELEKFFRRPDGLMRWDEWLRVVVEDMLVIDAATVYPRKTKGSTVHSLEIVDGATIKLLINEDGRTPLAPEPAYAQIIKGLQAAHYTTDELIYKPRNRRSWKHYGLSPVEQIIMTVNIALRRQVSQLQYYTEGNVPEALAACPPEWGPEQVKEMQVIWDQLIGQMDQKRHMRFVPGGIDVKFTREPTLKDTFDEWLARIVCYAFSVSPQALIQMMNRATAETAAETAALEGLAPLQRWVKGLIDDIIEFHFGYDDLVFAWDDGKELDPKTQMEINTGYLTAGVIDAEEVRKDIGREPRNQPSANPATPSGAAPVPSSAPLSAEAGQPPVDGTAGAVAAAGAAPEPQLGPDGQPVPPQLGPDGQPLPTPVPGAAGGGAKVADAAMNGTQVSSLLEIVAQVASKDLPEETAKATIMAAFPSIPEETIDAMLVPLRNFEPPKPEPLLGPDGQPIAPGAATAPVDNDDGNAPSADAKPSPDDSKKPALAKAHTHGKAKLTAQQRKVMTDALRKALESLGASVASQIENLREDVTKSLAKVKDKDAKTKRILAKLDMSFEEIEDTLLSSLEIVSTSAAATALKSTGVKGKDPLNLANTRAEKWAANHAAELVKDLESSTREMLRGSILLAEQEGWSNEQLARELRDNYAFSKQRAETVARTELKAADSEGAIAGWRASGLTMKKEWLRSANDADCEVCEANEQQGPIDLDDSFDSGDDTSPAHPNCECVVVSVIEDEDQ